MVTLISLSLNSKRFLQDREHDVIARKMDSLRQVRPFRTLMNNASKLDAGQSGNDLWAITCYFNPMRYQRRLANFRIFRDRLQLPLVAVELAYGQEFELQAQDAEILIQLRDGAVLWQKERLLNIALQALPSSCHRVAWLDCDIFFTTPGGSRTLILCSIDTRSFSCSDRCTILADSGLPEKIAQLRWSSRIRPPWRPAFPLRHLSAIFTIIEIKKPPQRASRGRPDAIFSTATLFTTPVLLAAEIARWPAPPTIVSTS